jgi:hypothetical protein
MLLSGVLADWRVAAARRSVASFMNAVPGEFSVTRS